METMASYILSILKQSPDILMSWGAESFTQLKNDEGLSFLVNGFVYQGEVKIIYDPGADLFNVQIGDQLFEGVYFDQLVSLIDSEVEKDCGDELYRKKIKEWLDSDEFQEMFTD